MPRLIKIVSLDSGAWERIPDMVRGCVGSVDGEHLFFCARQQHSVEWKEERLAVSPE